MICDLYSCGVWVESGDPVANLCPTNQFLYRTVQSSVNLVLVLLIVNNL